MQKNRTINIRKAKKSDSIALAKLADELGYPTTLVEMRSRLGKLLSKSNHGIFIAESHSILGWIQTSIIQSLESGTFAEILGLVVSESSRNSGIGTKLVSTAEIWAQKRGCSRIRVRTNVVREKTITFYKKLGFHSKKTQEVFDKKLQSAG